MTFRTIRTISQPDERSLFLQSLDIIDSLCLELSLLLPERKSNAAYQEAVNFIKVNVASPAQFQPQPAHHRDGSWPEDQRFINRSTPKK